MKYVLASLILCINTYIVSATDPMEYWHLVGIVDSRTVRIRSDEGKEANITLACVGESANETNSIRYLLMRLQNRQLGFWALDTSETNWMSRPMCLFIWETDSGHKGSTSLVYHLPMVNEELIVKRLVKFKDVEVSFDEYGLRARLYRASVLSNNGHESNRSVTKGIITSSHQPTNHMNIVNDQGKSRTGMPESGTDLEHNE